MYDPNLGRFLSEDPLDFVAGDPNLYRFAGNDPVNMSDPTGLSQAGHPLAGGFGGGILFDSIIPAGSIPDIVNNSPTMQASVVGAPGLPGAPNAPGLIMSAAPLTLAASSGPSAPTTSYNFDNLYWNHYRNRFSPLSTSNSEDLNDLPAAQGGSRPNTDIPNYLVPATPADALIESMQRNGVEVIGVTMIGSDAPISQQIFSRPAQNLFESILFGTIDALLPIGPQSAEVTFSNGVTAYVDSGGPYISQYFNQVLALGPAFSSPGSKPAVGGHARQYNWTDTVVDTGGFPETTGVGIVDTGTYPRVAPTPPTTGSGTSSWLPGRYSQSASSPGAYWQFGGRVFPTLRNSGLSGQALRQEQQTFFERGLQNGQSPALLRGQAAQAGYRRDFGINNVGGSDRLASTGAESALQQAMRNVGVTE
jgi:hypothetical protein